MCDMILGKWLLGGFNLLTQRGCCRSVYLLDPTGVLYRNDIYPVQVRIVVEGKFIRSSVSSSVSTEPRSVDSSSGLGLLFGYRRLAVMS